MTIRFTKMHGLGNDFIVIDAVRQSLNLQPTQIIELAKRDTGIGFDQCLVVEPSHEENIDFFYRIFNADGHEVGQCGNGARCLARFVFHYGLTDKKLISVATCTTKMQLKINADETVTVDMGLPKLNPNDIPLHAENRATFYALPLKNGSSHMVHAISVGNPHAITVVNELNTIDIANLGKQISEHELFPEQTNAGFMQIIDKTHISLRVYERGCGETRACGSGAVAAAAIGRLYHQLESSIRVNLPGGNLIVEWPDVTGSIYLKGPATFVYEGVLMP
ncbi:diaminopimelate epimerase [Legionella cardiaca]|uniref:Diaminopimelate epimerase n=1 Tax=Legionella cardiaca TaxID=1071983 RepID=A0ABY8AQS8_9GAMM|nr:diaminopimelate epimerase [Legionella cardiaca]WED42581.1 diaminopimelate epimerase [Legionella cardiaca]